MTQFEAGKYYIGDLMYVMHDVWDEFRDKFIDIDNQRCKLNDGREFWFAHTALGNGRYKDNCGQNYPVDAGIIGIVSRNDVLKHEYNNINLGVVHTFDEPFNVSYDNGIFNIGNIEIDTN